MEEFLLNDYNAKRSEKKQNETRRRKAKAKRAISLFDSGLRDLDVLAEALEVSKKTVESLIGKRRTAICLGIIDEDCEEKPKRIRKQTHLRKQIRSQKDLLKKMQKDMRKKGIFE